MRVAQEAGPVNDVRCSGYTRPEQARVVTRIVFQVRILHNHHITCGGGKPAAQRGSLALVLFLVDDLHTAYLFK